MGALAVIPAKGNSGGLAQKNLRLLCGKPVLSYSVRYAQREAEDFCITTNSQEIKDLYPWAFLEPPYISERGLTIDHCMRWAVEKMESLWKETYEIIVLLYGNVPVREEGLVERGIKLLNDGCGDSVKSWSAVPHEYHSSNRLHVKSEIYRRQDLQQEWCHKGSIVILRRKWLFDPLPGNFGYLGKTCLPLFITDECVNIDSEEDFKKAERKLCK